MNNLVYIDLETTGFQPGKNQIIQIGAYRPDTGDEFECKIQCDPDRCTPKTMAFLNLDIEAWNKTASTLPEAWDLFRAWAGKHRDCTPAGHNFARFDLAFLEATFPLFDHDETQWISKKTPFDTLIIANYLWPDMRHTLGDLLEKFGLTNPNPHDALFDVKANAKLGDKLIEIRDTLSAGL